MVCRRVQALRGGRSGALIATAWAALVHQGEAGYLQLTDTMMKVPLSHPHPSCPPRDNPAVLLYSFRVKADQAVLLPCDDFQANRLWAFKSNSLLSHLSGWKCSGIATDALQQAARAFAKGVEGIEGLELTGSPAMTVVGFKASQPRSLNIYAVNDEMSARGWHLSALQMPPALHMCFTAQHAHSVPPLLQARAAPSFFPPHQYHQNVPFVARLTIVAHDQEALR